MQFSNRIFAVSAAFFLVLTGPAVAASCYVADEDIAEKYVGPCVDGKAQGRGKASGRDTYEGDFVEGEQHGKGVYVWGPKSKAPGDRYEGDWNKGERTGKGVFVWPDGDRFDGEYRNGKTHGQGVWTRGDNHPCPQADAGYFCFVRQEGKFENGKFMSGKMNFADGDSYTGEVGYGADGMVLLHATDRGKGGGGYDTTKVFESFFGGLVETGRDYKQAASDALSGRGVPEGEARRYICRAKCTGFMGWVSGKVQADVQATNSYNAARMVEKSFDEQCREYPFSSNGSGKAQNSGVICDTY